MTKQDEIRDGVILNITKACPDMLNGDVVKLADKILKDEDSQGVVLKVARELPLNPHQSYRRQHRKSRPIGLLERVHAIAQNDMDKAGFVAVEPLI